MAQNWSQTFLFGLKQYMVGITANKRDSNERAIEELLLYSVDKVPSAVKVASEQNEFRVNETIINNSISIILLLENVVCWIKFIKLKYL